MEIFKLVVPPLDNNVYIVYDKETKEGYVIDVGLGANELASYIKTHKIKILGILLTHAHIDHSAHAFLLRKLINSKVMIHYADYNLLKEFFSRDYPYIDEKLEYEEPDYLFKDGEEFKFGKYSLIVIETPGHTPGSVCFYEKNEKVLFSGDTLFAGTYGRVDFPYSDENKMMESLRKLARLPKEVKVYPGHYEETKIEYEYWLQEI
ncbi:MAG: MBL fold metallo-hydrolase [Thermoproteota archaeon]|jgi:hydroxyacylglutathione hydrolase|nr:MBL fold metallo-hydrolase [Thermoproteota archaeon]